MEDVPINNQYSITILRKRLFALFCVITFLFFIILSRIFYVQIIWGDELQEKAIDQWTREIPIIARRGDIVDRNGVILATNGDTYTVFVRKKAVQNYENISDVLSKSLNLDYNYVYDRIVNTVSSEITIKKQVPKEELEVLLSYDLSGVYYSRDNFRVYPYGDFLSQVLGFTSTDGNGQAGLELYYDKYLKGIDGEILYETDIVGVEIGNTPTYVKATDGLNIKLTIDFEIQKIVESALINAYETTKAKSVQCIVIDPSTGQILALSIKPSLNLNDIPRDNLPLLNKLIRNTIISDVYEPGSTFKILTAVANVEEFLSGNKNAYSFTYFYNSSRYRYIDGTRVKCWSDHKNGKHANLTLEGALCNSCNPIFVDIAMALGKDTLYKYIDKFGYGSVTGVDFNGESQGMVLPKTSVLNVDLARISFGQTIAVTPIQLACATASAINGGKYYEPYFVSEIYSNDGIVCEIINPKVKRNTVSEQASKIISGYLETVAKEGGAKNAFIDGYRIAGKTGTAQKYENGIIANGKYVSSFIGYFPADNPKYLTLLIVDEPEGQYYGSTVAAPYAKEIFQKIIDLKNI